MKDDWIRVEDRLPEDDRHVLCAVLNKRGMYNIVKGYYADGVWVCGMNSNVTHWMPLPEPPRN